jgi:transposase
MKEIEKHVVKKIEEYKRNKITISKIAELLDISPTSVKKYSKKVVRNFRKNERGRPKKLSMEISKNIYEKFKINKFKNLQDGRKFLWDEFKLDVSRQTVKNYLNSKKLKCYVKTKKPLLSEIHRKKRFEFSLTYLGFSFFDWKNVIFSDESKFALINTNNKEFYCPLNL